MSMRTAPEKMCCYPLPTEVMKACSLLFIVLVLGCSPAPSPVLPSPEAPTPPREVSARLPPEVIQRVVRANFGVMRRCYEDGLRSDPWLMGRVITRFVIGVDRTRVSGRSSSWRPPA